MPDWLIQKVLKRFAKKFRQGVSGWRPKRPEDRAAEAGAEPSRPHFVLLLTITPATKFVSRFGWLRTHSE